MMDLIICLLLVIISWQLQGIRQLIESRTDPGKSPSFASLLKEIEAEEHEKLSVEAELPESAREMDDSWQKLRQQAQTLAEEGMSMSDMARTLGVGQGELQLLLRVR